MRCDCCDKLLNDSEATAKFTDSGNYVNMCSKCRGHLPKDLKITLRKDFETQELIDPYVEEADHDYQEPIHYLGFDEEEENYKND